MKVLDSCTALGASVIAENALGECQSVLVDKGSRSTRTDTTKAPAETMAKVNQIGRTEG